MGKILDFLKFFRIFQDFWNFLILFGFFGHFWGFFFFVDLFSNLLYLFYFILFYFLNYFLDITIGFSNDIKNFMEVMRKNFKNSYLNLFFLFENLIFKFS